MRCSALAVSLLSMALVAQADERDPYTKHDPAAMRRAGIVAVESFMWGKDHSTRAIQSLLGFEPIRFLETVHFKLGVSLSAQGLPSDPEDRAALRAELRALAAVLPAVDADTKVVDGWLRAHLYARRLEALYAEFSKRLRVDPVALAAARPGSAYGSDYVGEGPYLGQPGKYQVLLLRDQASVASYLKNFANHGATRRASRHVCDDGASLLLAAAELMPDEDLRRDGDLHAAVVHHTTHLLLDGYRYYWHDCAPWLEEGLAQWFRAEFVPRHVYFGERPADLPLQPNDRAWRSKLRVRVARERSVSSASLFDLPHGEQLSFEQVLAAWSRVDFLLREHGAMFPPLLQQLKGPDPSKLPPRPSAADVMARQRAAFVRVFGWGCVDFDAAWSTWVMNEYRQ